MTTLRHSPATAPVETRGGRWIEHWEPNDPAFAGGRRVARRNLVFSVFAEFLAFSVWQVFSIVAAFYVTCALLTWYVYARPRAEVPC